MPRPNRGPYLAPNRHGTYDIAWTENGRSRRRSTGTPDFREAQKHLARFLMQHDREAYRELVKTRILLVRDILGDPAAPDGEDYWHEHVLEKVVGRDTQRYAIQKLVAHFGDMEVRQVDPADVAAYVRRRRAGDLGKPSKDGTIARELSVLVAAVRHAVRARRVKADDAPRVELPPPSPPKDRWLTKEEATRLLEAARQAKGGDGRLPRVYRFIVLALMTASRRTAILELKKDQIDLENGLIRLNPAGRRQTKKRRPPVPISDELRPVLERMMSEASSAYLLDHPGSVRAAFDRAVARAGLEDVTPHTLRHTWATWAAQAGVDMWKIAGVLGDTLATVERTYAHHHPNYLRGAVNAIGLSVAA